MLAPQHRARERRQLKKRADYFFGSSVRYRSEVGNFSKELLALGSTVVIGGFLRDLWLVGNRDFRSDVDFVVNPNSLAEFERFVSVRGGTPNRFGGFAISLKRWKVDVWPLEKTWAAVAGHVKLTSLDDLLKATFFDWDAILYSVDRQKLIADERYFDKLEKRVIDINLAPNPNPMGNTVRAIRYAYRWNASFGHKLACHVAKQIVDAGWASIMMYERRSSYIPILGSLDGDLIFSSIERQIQGGHNVIHLPLRPYQQEFDISDNAR